MAQSRSTNTQSEALRGLLGNIADMKVMPDADISYLTNLETMILGYLRAPFEAQQQANQTSPTVPPGVAAQAGGIAALGGAAPVMGGGMAGPAPRVPGILNHAPMPPVDELRRLLK